MLYTYENWTFYLKAAVFFNDFSKLVESSFFLVSYRVVHYLFSYIKTEWSNWNYWNFAIKSVSLYPLPMRIEIDWFRAANWFSWDIRQMLTTNLQMKFRPTKNNKNVVSVSIQLLNKSQYSLTSCICDFFPMSDLINVSTTVVF